MNINDIDLSELRAIWARRREAAASLRARSDPTGMTRPPRDPDERAFLEERGLLGPFTEVEMPGWREWMERKNTPPKDER
jgi:hypothetical protein